ncbi:33K [Fowl aviadenovirus B]|nr:33K [Fowl aviadenovirus B]
MAQRMIDEKTRIVEELPADENAVPFPTNLRAPYGEEEDSERSRETDGESLGSEDTEEEDPLTPISEEEEELEDEEKENVPPPSQHRKRRRSAFSPAETLTRPPIRNQKKKKKLGIVSFSLAVDSGLQTPRRRGSAKREHPNGASAASENPQPVPQSVADLKAQILDILLDIEAIARKNPTRRISIRNRTRESITRQLHYVKNEEKLTKLKTDAEKILHLWRTLS